METNPHSASKELYRTIFEQAADGIFIAHAQERFLEVNPQGCKLLGYSREEMAQLSWSEVLVAESTSESLSLDEGVNNKTESKECQMRDKDGRLLAVEIRWQRLADGHLLAFVRDMTERKQTEEQVLYQANLLRNVSDAIIATDLDFRITSWNEAAEALYGWKAAEVLGQSINNLLQTEFADAQREQVLRQFLEQGIWHGEAIQKRKDNTRITVLASVSLVKDSAGQAVGAVAVNRDISEYKRVEAEILKLAKFSEENPNPVLRVSQNGILLYANLASTDLLESWNCTLGRRLPDPWSQLVLDTYNTRLPREEEVVCGESIFSLVLTPIVDDDYVNIYGYDITARKQAEEAFLTSENNYRILSEYNRQLNDISISFNEATTVDDLLRTIAESYRRLTGAIATIVSQYEQPTKIIRLVTTSMDESLLDRIEAILGFSLFEIKIVVPDEMIPLMINQSINKTDDLVALSFNHISQETADRFMITIGCTQIIVLVLNYKSELLGTNIAFLTERQAEISDQELKTFAHMAGLTLTRKKAEESLQESEHRFRALIENSADSIALLNTEGTILYESPAVSRILGYQPEELLGRNVMELLHSDDQATAAELFGQAIRQPQTPITGQFRYRHKDGAWHWIEATGTNLLNNPNVHAIVVNYSDITERKRAEEMETKLEEQLRQAQKMESVGLLAGGVAHDFNNLLTVIQGYSTLLQSKISPTDPPFGPLEQIRIASERAAMLTRQLLAFSRKQMLAPTILDLNNLVTNLHKMLERLIGEDIRLMLTLQPGLWPVMADPSQIEQVIMNLAVNARDAMPTGGILTLETSNIQLDASSASSHFETLSGPYTMLAVTDTGHGMDELTTSHIFEPFFTTKEVGQGTGLGLATVYGIVKQSGGDILVYSEPDQGTSFKIYLPAHKTHSKDLPDPQTEPVSRGGHETILLVEDEEIVGRIVEVALQDKGYTILAARLASEALSLSQQHQGPIDLLLTDVVMPQMSGRELAEQLKALRPGLKVLFMSGYTDDAIVRHGLLMAEIEFLSKPFSPSKLASKVREILDK